MASIEINGAAQWRQGNAGTARQANRTRQP